MSLPPQRLQRRVKFAEGTKPGKPCKPCNTCNVPNKVNKDNSGNPEPESSDRPLTAFEQRVLSLLDPTQPTALDRLRQQPPTQSACCGCVTNAMCGGLRCWGYCLGGVVALFICLLAVLFFLVSGARFAYWYAGKPWPGPL